MKKALLTAAFIATTLTAAAQWPTVANSELPLYPSNRDYPASQMKTSPLGYSWFFLNEMGAYPVDPTPEDPSGLKLIETYLTQGFKPDGTPIMGSEPKSLSKEDNISWTMVNDNIIIDKDGNAIVTAQDLRRFPDCFSMTAYKISPEGKQLWGDEGVLLTGNEKYSFLCGSTSCQLSDGSYVFAWFDEKEGTNAPLEINLMRVKADGTLAWKLGDVRLSDRVVPYSYPMLVAAEGGEFYLVYAEGTGQYVMAMRYDFNGEQVWEEPTDIYNGGWGSTPMWLKCKALSSGDGGLLFVWYDDRDFTDTEDPYLAYVNADGELVFNVPNGLCLDYSEYRRVISIRATYDPGTDSFIAFYRVISGGQSSASLKAQRISKTGDLLWGEESKIIANPTIGGYGLGDVVVGEKGKVAFFYQRADDPAGRVVNNVVDYYDVETGERVWSKPIEFGVANTPKTELQAGSCGDFWTASWTGNVWIDDPTWEGGGYYSSSIGNINAHRINFDGSFGDPTAITSAKADNAGAKTEYFTLDGRKVNANHAPGIVIKKQGGTVKKAVK